jgi:hypothetical protein
MAFESRTCFALLVNTPSSKSASRMALRKYARFLGLGPPTLNVPDQPVAGILNQIQYMLEC